MSGVLLAAALAAPVAPAGAAPPPPDYSNSDVDVVTFPDLGKGWASIGSAAVVGDVNGDRIDDLAMGLEGTGGWGQPLRIVFGQSKAGTHESAWSRPGFTIEGGGSASIAPAGDTNGDGLGDIAILGWSAPATVVFGKRDEHPVDLFDLGTRGFTIGGTAMTSRTGSGGLWDNEGIAGVGDQNGDGRDDIAAVASGPLKVVHTPPSPAGAYVNTYGEFDGSLITAGGAGLRFRPLPGGGGDSRTDLLLHWDSPEGARMAGLFGPSDDDRIEASQIAEQRRGWELSTGGTYAMAVAALGDQNGDQRPEAGLSLTYPEGLQVALSPALGVEGRIEDVPGYRSEWWSPVIGVGDLDGDGRGDLASGLQVRFTDDPLLAGTGRIEEHGFSLPYLEGWHSTIIGTTRDADGDGTRELVVARTGEGHGAGRYRLEVWRSGTLPREPVPIPGGGGGVWHGGGPPWGDVPRAVPQPAPELGLAVLAPTRGREGFSAPELSTTPEYRDGKVLVTVRAPRAGSVDGTATGKSWRGGAWTAVGQSRGQAGAVPYAPLEFTLPAPLRAAIEREGKLRMRLDAVITTRAGRKAELGASFVVVTRRPPPLALRRRTLNGSFGVQRLIGSRAHELLRGHSADDTLLGRGGSDVLEGGTGNDVLLGGDGADALDGNDGDDDLRGGAGNDDVIEGRFGDDQLDGGPGDDHLFAGRGHDTLEGGAGDDVVAGGSGPDRVSCGAGEDIAFVNFFAERRSVADCEHLYEEPGVVHMPCADGGTDGPETVLGTDSRDVCDGRGGNDDVEGRAGDDVLLGGAGDDRIFGRFGADRLDGGDGADELEGGRGRDTLAGGGGDDRLNGGLDPDLISGGAGADQVTARGGGRDRIDCGPGVDTAYVDSQDVVRSCERVRRSGVRRKR